MDKPELLIKGLARRENTNAPELRGVVCHSISAWRVGFVTYVLCAAFWPSAHFASTAATFAVLLRRHRAFAISAARHFAGGVLGHHGAGFTVFTLAAASALAARTVFRAAVRILSAAGHFAVSLAVIAAGTGLGGVVVGRRRALRSALRHQSQSHQDSAYKYESFRFHNFLRIPDQANRGSRLHCVPGPKAQARAWERDAAQTKF